MMTRTATKADTSGQNFRVLDLRAEQQAALAVLVAGGTDQLAADAAGVSRQTVNGWAHCDERFVAALNRERAALWAGLQDRLRSMTGAALSALQDDLQSDDPGIRRQAALTVLKLTGAGLAAIPAGASDPDGIRLQWLKEHPGPLEFLGWSS